MLRPLSVLALAALLSATVAASGDPQSKPKPPAPRKTAPKPAPAAPAAPVAAKPKPPAPPPPATDVRMKTAYTQGAQVSENTTYLQGARQRVEFPGVVTLDQCDLKRSVMLNIDAKRYRVQPYPVAEPQRHRRRRPTAAQAQRSDAAATPQPPRGGVVTFTTTLTDTLERQTMFGLEARRIKTRGDQAVQQDRLRQVAAQGGSRRVVRRSAGAVWLHAARRRAPRAAALIPPHAPTRVETRVVGDVKLGFPVKTATTTTTGEGDKVES